MSTRPRNWPSPLLAIKAGDLVVRMLGLIPMQLTVSAVDEQFIYCGGSDGWKFDRLSGVEVDEDIGWGPDGVVGSFLLPPGEVDLTARGTNTERERAAEAPTLVSFRTMTGSRYQIDNTERTWRRSATTLASGRLRTEAGNLLEDVVPQVGECAILRSEPIVAGTTERIVVTSVVVQIEDQASDPDLASSTR